MLKSIYQSIYNQVPDPLKPYTVPALICLGIVLLCVYNAIANGASAAPEILAICGIVAGGIIYNVFNQIAAEQSVKKIADKMLKDQEKTRISNMNSKDFAKKQMEELYDSRITWVDKFARRMRSMLNIKDDKIKDLRLEVQAAGMRSERAVSAYLTALGIAPFAGFVAGWLFANLEHYNLMKSVASIVGGGVVAMILVRQYMGGKAKARRKEVNKVMPEIIDLLVIYSRAGASSDTAIRKIGEGLKRRYPATADEISFLWQEMQILSDRTQALNNFQERQAGSSIVQGFASIMIQQERMGAQISESLYQLSTESRRDRLQEAKKKAAKLPVIMQVPVVMFILPSLFIVILGPAVVQVLTIFHVI